MNDYEYKYDKYKTKYLRSRQIIHRGGTNVCIHCKVRTQFTTNLTCCDECLKSHSSQCKQRNKCETCYRLKDVPKSLPKCCSLCPLSHTPLCTQRIKQDEKLTEYAIARKLNKPSVQPPIQPSNQPQSNPE